MKYLYYPGCSLEGTALEYHESTKAFMGAIGAELREVEGWTCCGASAATATGHLLSLALPARTLALAEKQNSTESLLVPCSACYLNLKNVGEKVRGNTPLLNQINRVLNEDQLIFSNKIRVKHLLEVIAKDIGAKTLQPMIKQSFNGMTIAPYYGCQAIRPYPVFDDPEWPRSMEPLIKAVGARVHSWDMGGKCCGASHVNTKMEVGIRLITEILKKAKGADAIVTVCPMCQMNIEAFQSKISNEQNENLRIPVLYLPQFLGLAIGLTPKEVRLDLNLSDTKKFEVPKVKNKFEVPKVRSA